MTQKFQVPKVLAQTAKLAMPSKDSTIGFATLLTIDGRQYYDAKFRATILLANEGTYGMVFRYIDQFNYYAFQVVKIGKIAEIRITKMLYG